jgi:hypothetical protein
MNSWDDTNFVAEIERSGRKKIVLAGLWTETCVALPTVQAIHDGYDVHVVEDCCGDVSQLAHENAMKRVIQAGAKPVTALSVMLEWQRDWAARDTYDAVMDIVKTHCGAYGLGVEYAYTMVHGAPATKYPRVRRPGSRCGAPVMAWHAPAAAAAMALGPVGSGNASCEGPRSARLSWSGGTDVPERTGRLLDPHGGGLRPTSRAQRRLSVWALGLVLLASTLGCDRGTGAGPAASPPPPTVVVAEVVRRTVPIVREYTARTEAVPTIEVRARVPGVLEQVSFEEGSEVKALGGGWQP